MNRSLKWGMGFFAGVFIGNLFWLYGLDSPTARFLTAGWFELWFAAYGLALMAILIGLIQLRMRQQNGGSDGGRT
jgi:hypothetical protein